jgi:hypothetical protein
MNKLFDGIVVTGIVIPGETYIFSESASPAYDPGPLNLLYVIRKDEEILQAVEMEFCTVLTEMYDLRKFLGIRRLSDDCYEFRCRCFEKQLKQLENVCLYLHRVRTFKERLEEVKTQYLPI